MRLISAITNNTVINRLLQFLISCLMEISRLAGHVRNEWSYINLIIFYYVTWSLGRTSLTTIRKTFLLLCFDHVRNVLLFRGTDITLSEHVILRLVS